MKLYISDLHFYSEKVLKMDNREFSDCRTMNQFMIEQWNKKVKSGDIIIVLGDFFETTNPDEVNYVLNRLSGKIYLIEGNHDCVWLKKEGVNLNRFEWIKPYAELTDGDSCVILSHYPTFCYNHQHTRKEDGSPKTYMLYGHVHDSYDEALINQFQDITRKTIATNAQGVTGPLPCQMINCFCKYSNYQPLSLKEWIKLDSERRSKIDLNK